MVGRYGTKGMTLPGMILLVLLCLPASIGAMSDVDDISDVYHPMITTMKGAVSVMGADYAVWEDATEGMLLLAGDTLKTGKGAYVRIAFSSGALEVYETSVVVIPSMGVEARQKDIREVIIDQGKTLFDINPLGVQRGFEFKTRNIQGGVKGTLFTVSYLEGGTAVNVYRGVVDVSDPDGSRETKMKLHAGKFMRVEGESGFGTVKDFDPSSALKDYQNKIPPGLNEKGLPADYNANLKNKGVRNRGVGKPDSTRDVSDEDPDDSSNDNQGDDDDDQGDDEQ